MPSQAYSLLSIKNRKKDNELISTGYNAGMPYDESVETPPKTKDTVCDSE